jgi:DNA adenine methylase
VSNKAQSCANKIGRLEEFAAWFDDVVLENLDWSEAFEKYDGEKTVFYCDPPYVGKEGYYPVSEIDHSEFVEALGGLEGGWVVSYAELPDGLDEYRVVGRGERNFMGNGKTGSAKRTREQLVMNFEPEEM